MITLGAFGDFSVTGVLKDHPVNSHMTFEVILPTKHCLLMKSSSAVSESDRWENFRNNYIYLTLPQGSGPASVDDQLLDRISREAYAQSPQFKAEL